MKQKDAAEQVLKQNRHPMHVKDIVEQAKRKGLIKSGNPIVEDAIAASMRTDIKKLGDQSRFVKVEWAKATYGLRAWPAKRLDKDAHVTRKGNSDGADPRSDGPTTYKLAAYKILLNEGGPLHKNEIAKRAKKRGLIKNRTNPRIGDSIAAQIDAEISKMGTKSRFFKEKASTYGLRKPDEPPQGVKGPDYTGPAGEHMVQAELLFRKYQTSKPEPDIGVDIVANKDGKEFHIQVKSSNIESGSYRYNIKKSSFERTKKKNVYYVFVMRRPDTGRVDFVITPRNEMLGMIKEEKITTLKREHSEDLYQVILKMVGGTAFCKGQQMDTNTWTIK